MTQCVTRNDLKCHLNLSDLHATGAIASSESLKMRGVLRSVEREFYADGQNLKDRRRLRTADYE